MAESRNNNQPQANALQMINHAPVLVVQGGIRYGKCTHNHAAAIGRHATDGCNQFIPATYDPLFCAVCGCHQNFHKHEPPPFHRHHRSSNQPQLEPLQPPPIAILEPIITLAGGGPGEGPAVVTQVKIEVLEVKREEVEVVETEAPVAVARARNTKTRRTTFTAEQKRKMTQFATMLGWRSRKRDKEMIENFCQDIGISMRVFKIWLSNNRHRRTVM